MLHRFVEWIRGNLIDQKSQGGRNVQIGFVAGNLHIHQGSPHMPEPQEVAAVEQLVKHVGFKKVRRFMKDELRSLTITALNKHDLRRLRLYCEAIIHNTKSHT